MSSSEPATLADDDITELASRACGLLAGGSRALVGIAGPPGAGKSTLAARLASRVGEPAVVVPMDGFHLAQAELVRLGRAGRKGAIDTFDGAGFVALLARVRAAGRDGVDEVVYTPGFSRALEEPIAGSIPVCPWHKLVVVEGNYLLVGDGVWAGVRPLLDAAWYLDVPPAVRRDRLVARYVGQGRTVDSALRQADGSDAANAELVESWRQRADLVLTSPLR